MRRVVVLGCGGSGKTYLARALASKLDLPVTHLDALYYDEHWNVVPMSAFAAAQRELVADSDGVWVIEGNYASTLPIRLSAADTAILLDPPAWVCLAGIARRHVRWGTGQHRDTGVFNRISWSFVRYLFAYRRRMLPRVHAAIDAHAPKAAVIVLRSRREARTLVAQVASRPVRDRG